ncbi:hypothetical protein [Mycolicibacterium sp. S3B2]|uniref:hypothetical protein n=1 Tax=Mycolicibacterium sp. S3B2 TaxID=3415120 RepID=UPI003C7ABAC7
MHQLSDFVAIWAAQRASFGWFFGAGVSASAGVPTATAVRDRLLCERYAIEHQLVRQDVDESDPTILQRVHRYFDGRNGMPALRSDGDYSAAFELVVPDEAARKRYLEDLFAGARPGFGHRVFGGLLVAGYCNLVITTNFDPLIEQGFTDALRRGTDAGELASATSAASPTPRVVSMPVSRSRCTLRAWARARAPRARSSCAVGSGRSLSTTVHRGTAALICRLHFRVITSDAADDSIRSSGSGPSCRPVSASANKEVADPAVR